MLLSIVAVLYIELNIASWPYNCERVFTLRGNGCKKGKQWSGSPGIFPLLDLLYVVPNDEMTGIYRSGSIG